MCFILVFENLRNFRNYTRMAWTAPALVSAWVCCLFICIVGFSQDLQRRWIARSSTFFFYIQQYSLLNQSSNIGSEKAYLFPSFSMKSRSVSIRLLRVMVCALPHSYFRTTGMELKRYSPSATARSMAVWAAVRFSVSFMNIGMLVSISWRVRISIISSVTFSDVPLQMK